MSDRWAAPVRHLGIRRGRHGTAGNHAPAGAGAGVTGGRYCPG